ncbi:choice-of-anchor D domain-containing protein [Actinokineospora sp. NBRC 105648]|uniref:choice-of-anchor D domain-containing protein n=1 Tax=Actinokineospora sp. NBRC 105648 TaxID=3032206 RepID=UPI0024A40081|nr:choice-of-anchor D domain-containing protein [Actinokineospora sp. NBRC 105648]GLZ39470.1 hypothetical protein Acsp05_30940 [Actinokineospora sp. NBRC 105648]
MHRAVVVSVIAVLGVGTLLVAAGPAPAVPAAGSTVLASVDTAGTPSPNGGADQDMSLDGTAVVFTSTSPLDSPTRPQTRNVFVRDLARGRTVLISRGQLTRPTVPPSSSPTSPPSSSSPPPSSSSSSPPTSSSPPSGDSGPIPLAGKRLVAFAQPAVVYGETAADGESLLPTISRDGRFVAFITAATNIIEADPYSHYDVLLCDRAPNGVFDARKPDGSMDYRYSQVTVPGPEDRPTSPDRPRLAADATRIVWSQTSSSGDYGPHLFVADLTNGVASSVRMLSTASPNSPTIPLSSQVDPDISADGRLVVSAGVSRVVDTDTVWRSVIRTDVAANTNTRVDFDADGTVLDTDGSVRYRRPAISADGKVIAFVAARQTDQPNIYVVRPEAVVPPGTKDSELVSRDNAGNPVNANLPGLSADGRYLAFVTDAPATHDGADVPLPEYDGSCLQPSGGLRAVPPVDDARDNRVRCQVVVRDLVVDRARGTARLPGALASVAHDTDCPPDVDPVEGDRCPGDSTPELYSAAPSLSADGGRVAFESSASDLADDDSYFEDDVFVHTFEPGLTGDPVTFGTATVGDTVNRTVTVRHTGFGPLPVESVSLQGNDFSTGADACTGAVLHVTGTCLVAVRFTPTVAGARDARLVIKVRGGREFTVDLSGTGSTRPVIPPNAEFAAGPDPLDFGPRLMLSDGPALPLTVRNNGGSPMMVTGTTADSPDFTVDATACLSAPVPPAGTCAVQVRFSPAGPSAPAAPSFRPGILTFTSTAPGGPHLVAVRGEAVQPALDLNPAVISPGRVSTATGTGFPPGKPVTLTFRETVGSATVVSGANGRFSTQLLVFPKASIGPRTVVATVDTTAIAAERPLLVVINTVSPAEFVGRG